MKLAVLALICLALSWTSRAGAASASATNSLSPEELKAGWKLLFDGRGLTGWHSLNKKTPPEKGWIVEAGWLHCAGKEGGDLLSDELFGDFELAWEWRISPNGNSGVKYFVDEAGANGRGHEYQLIDDNVNEDAKQANGKRITAAFYDVLKPTGTQPKQPGRVNESRVIVKGQHVEHWLNGSKVLEYECGSEALKAAIVESKFKDAAGFAEKRTGSLLLQNHHNPVWFRNVKVRALK